MIIGIDLGTTNSLVSVFKDGKGVIIPNGFGELLTPSVVSVDEQGSIIVGKLAKERLITHPRMTVAQFKRDMGTGKKFLLGNLFFTAEELSSFVLRKLIEDAKEYLQEDIDEIVVSVPAYFNDDQRWATKTAGQLAGVYIERIINEPSAAALSIHQNVNKEYTYVVVDFGGGTLDISVVDAFDNIVEIVSVAGDNCLGGGGFDQLILEDFLKRNQLTMDDLSLSDKKTLLKKSELIKIALNTEKESSFKISIQGEEYHYNLTFDYFFSISKELLFRIDKPVQKALRDSKNKVSDIDNIVLVGGSCKMRIVQEYLQYLFQNEVKIILDPDLAIAYGCGLVAGIKTRNEDIKDILLTDICPFSLGTDVVGGYFSPIIERNSVLPCSKETTYITSKLGQTTVKSGIYQGDNLMVKDNLKLGSLKIKVPKNKYEHEEIKVRFTYDINGILEVDVKVVSTHEIYHSLIVSERNRMTNDQISVKLNELQKLKIHPRDEEKNQYVLEKAKRLYFELLGEDRERLRIFVVRFEEALESQEPRFIKRAYDEFIQQIADFEEESYANADKGLYS